MHAMRAGGAPAGTRHRTRLPHAPRGRGGLRAQPRDGHRGVHCIARGVARPSAPAARRAAASPARGGRVARAARARARRRRRRASMAGQRVWWRSAARLQGKGPGALRRGAAQLGHQRLVESQHARERGFGAPARADRGPLHPGHQCFPTSAVPQTHGPHARPKYHQCPAAGTIPAARSAPASSPELVNASARPTKHPAKQLGAQIYTGSSRLLKLRISLKRL